MRRLGIAPEVFRAMIARCQAVYPEEGCGLLGGTGDVAWHHYPLTNVAVDPSARFIVDPWEQREAMSRMEALGEQLVAIYHSHPRTSAVPSRTDIRESRYPNVFHVIVSLMQRERPTVRAYLINSSATQAVGVHWSILRRPHPTGPHYGVRP